MYKIINHYDENTQAFTVGGVLKTGVTEIIIPFDPDNTDYQEYLEWLAEGNVPLPADTPGDVETDSV